MNDDLICPCDTIVHPRSVENPPGREALTYRAGDFASFRDALLRARDGERDLAGWRPSAAGDLALQLIEWWAYLADILTFYNERIANDAYLRTARGRATAVRLGNLLGYRPRPALGATGRVLASVTVVTGAAAVTIPKGLPIQSKPPAGKPPEVFEVDQSTAVHPFNVLAVDVAVDVPLSGATTLFVQGMAETLRPGHPVLFIKKGSLPSEGHFAFATIKALLFPTDTRGRKYRKMVFTKPLALPAGAVASAYDFMSEGFASNAPFPEKVTVETAPFPLVKTGKPIELSEDDIVLLTPGNSDTPLILTTALGVNQIFFDPPPQYTEVLFPAGVNLGVFAGVNYIKMSYHWRNAGNIICDPTIEVHVPLGASESARTITVEPTTFYYPSLPANGAEVLLMDVSGRSAFGLLVSTARVPFSFGTQAGPSVSGPGQPTLGLINAQIVAQTTRLSKVTLQFPPDTVVDLIGPLTLLFDLLPVSRGQTVPSEVLGSGDATQKSQAFTLKKSPLTYLATSDPAYAEGYASTLRILVDGVAWTEVESFYDQAPDAHVFLTSEDEEQKTHILFGDGVNGSRLPTGAANIVATYRFGGGASAPPAGSLNTPLKAYPGLKSVQNPVKAGGGADPDTAQLIRLYAPRSSITLGRAVSEDDYETIAARAPSVTRARSLFDWDPSSSRALVMVFVGGGDSAVAATKAALAATADPDRPYRVLPATSVPCTLSLRLLVDRRHDPITVQASVLESLLDPLSGLFRPEITRIGATMYDSWVHDTCLRVAGVLAVHDLGFSGGFTLFGQHTPGKDAYFTLNEASIHITTEVSSHAD